MIIKRGQLMIGRIWYSPINYHLHCFHRTQGLCLVNQIKHEGWLRYNMSCHIKVYSDVPIITVDCRMTANEYVDILNYDVLIMITTLLPDTAMFQDENAPTYIQPN